MDDLAGTVSSLHRPSRGEGWMGKTIWYSRLGRNALLDGGWFRGELAGSVAETGTGRRWRGRVCSQGREKDKLREFRNKESFRNSA